MKMDKLPLLVIAAGGTGGHMFPAQALAEEMMRRGWRVKLMTDVRGVEYAGGFPHVTEVEHVHSATPSHKGIGAKLKVPFQILKGIWMARHSMKCDRPVVVVGFGGYATVPVMLAAGRLKIPRIIHEQNGVLGRVNRKFAARVDAVACGTWPIELPKNVKGLDIGNPVRRAILEKKEAAYIAPGDWPMSLLVIGGSQGAHILSKTVPDAVALLPEAMKMQLRVVHQAREEDKLACEKAYAEADVRAEVSPFFRDVARLMAEAQLIISRAGASSIADICTIGRPSIFVPLAIATDDHQTANAKNIVAAGGAISIPETQFEPETLAKYIMTILQNADGAEQMAMAALSKARPNATKDLADLTEHLAIEGIRVS